jgi:hypothetical protein
MVTLKSNVSSERNRETTMAEVPGTGGMDRRSLLKKGAAAGALVWAAPAVTNMSVAHATNIPGDGRFTNCTPEATYLLQQTGANCGGWNSGNSLDLTQNCCDEKTYVLVTAVGCGDTCAGSFRPGDSTSIISQKISGQGEIGPRQSCSDDKGLTFYQAGNCNQAGTVVLEIISRVQCEDGLCYDLVENVTFNLTNCPLNAGGDVVPGTTLTIPISCD